MTGALYRLGRKLSWPSVLALVLTIIVIGYAGYRMKDVLRGPRLLIKEPAAENLPLAEPLFALSGEARRAAHLYLNDGRIFADGAGQFEEKLMLFPGYNIIKLEANDRFGRRTFRFLELTYQPTEQ